MIRDVFYYGEKPNAHPREKHASSYKDALSQCTTENFWIINELCDYRNFDWEFDFEFLPDEYVWTKDYINIWPSQWQKDSGTWLCSVHADPDIKIYRTDVDVVKRKNIITKNWKNTEKFSPQQFDYSWHPDIYDLSFNYQFGTQWAKTHGPIYVTDKATDTKYMDNIVATILPDLTNWHIPEVLDTSKFDLSWHPDGTSPPYIYQFGTVLDDLNLEDGPRYSTPKNNGNYVLMDNEIILVDKIEYPKYYITSTLTDLIEEHKNETFWALRKGIDYTEFDFSWKPNKHNVFHINAFGSTESETTQSYFVNGKMYQMGYKDINYVENIKLDEEYLSKLFKPMDMFYVDRSNIESVDRYDLLKLRFPSLQKTRYAGTWVDTINRCANKSNTELFWVLNSELDYTDFDFKYYPNPWQMNMTHVFGTQWSNWGTTYIVNKETFFIDTKYIKVIEHLNNLNFVKNKRANATNCLYDILLIDHGNKETHHVKELLYTKTNNNISVYQYKNSYLDTLREFVKSQLELKDHYVWVCSSICDYTDFDFTYICDPFTKEQLHVFPSDRQKYGDTFLINVSKMREILPTSESLEDFKVNYNNHQRPSRLPAPLFVTDETHVGHTNIEFDFPYAILITHDSKHIDYKDSETVNLWSEKDKTILITHTGGTRIILPKEATKIVKNELYDYPYVNTISNIKNSEPLDIIFFSNGETVADENYEHLLKYTKDMPNKVKRIDRVTGRVASQHAAANISDTPWYFLVNAKLRVEEQFDWLWQPDRLQEPKHYIFNALNPVNQLEYGHMAIVANNKSLALNTVVNGLDFTLSSKHESVNILSGRAIFNSSEYETWRTAFRESIKLKHSMEVHNDTASKYRLRTWLKVAEGRFSNMSLQGAKDAVEYYEAVNGDMDNLMFSYDWQWLSEFYQKKHK